MMAFYRRHCGWCLVVLCASLIGCASGPQANPADPFEPLNRKVLRFNEVLDDNALKPVAKAYQAAVPGVVQTGVSNFFGNLADMWSVVNNLLQAKPKRALETSGRVAVNTVFGLLGVIDVATPLNLERNKEDFGQTLGRWGMPAGPFVVLPLLGPSTLRDTGALVLDTQGDVVNRISDAPTWAGAYLLRITDKRASLLQAGQMLEQASLDKYSFIRSAWLQKRRSDVYDGDPPEEPELPDNSLPESNP